VYAKISGDVVITAAYSHELPGFGIPVGLTNYAASYATGLLMARRHLKKLGLDTKYQGNTQAEGQGNDYTVAPLDDGPRPFLALLDVGLARTSTGAKIFAAMKGVADGGIDVPHSETRFFGYDSENKKYDAEAHRGRILGTHVADYMRSLKDEDEDSYKRQFSKFITAGLTADGLEGMYKAAHAAIRKNPEVQAPKEKKVEKKRWTAKRRSLPERKNHVKNTKAYLLRLKALQEAQE